MSEFIEGILKTVEDVADAITGDTKAVRKRSVYSYTNFLDYCKTIKQREAGVQMALVSAEKVNSFEGVFYPSKKYLIKIVFLANDSQPLLFSGDDKAYLGMIVLADTIDEKFHEFLGDSTTKKVRIK